MLKFLVLFGWIILPFINSCKKAPISKTKSLIVRQSHSQIRPLLIKQLHEWYQQDTRDLALFGCEIENSQRPLDKDYLATRERRIRVIKEELNLWNIAAPVASFESGSSECSITTGEGKELSDSDVRKLVNGIKHSASWDKIYSFYWRVKLRELWQLSMLDHTDASQVKTIYALPKNLTPNSLHQTVEHLVILALGHGIKQEKQILKKLELFSLTKRLLAYINRKQEHDKSPESEALSSTKSFLLTVYKELQKDAETTTAEVNKMGWNLLSEQISYDAPLPSQKDANYYEMISHKPLYSITDPVNNIFALLPYGDKKWLQNSDSYLHIPLYRKMFDTEKHSIFTHLKLKSKINPTQLYLSQAPRFFQFIPVSFLNNSGRKVEANPVTKESKAKFQDLTHKKYHHLCQMIFQDNTLMGAAFQTSYWPAFKQSTNLSYIHPSDSDYDILTSAMWLHTAISSTRSSITTTPGFLRMQFMDIDFEDDRFSSLSLPSPGTKIECGTPAPVFNSEDPLLKGIKTERKAEIYFTESFITPLILDRFDLATSLALEESSAKLNQSSLAPLLGYKLSDLGVLDSSYISNSSLVRKNDSLAIKDFTTGSITALNPSKSLPNQKLVTARFFDKQVKFIWAQYKSVSLSPTNPIPLSYQNCLWVFDTSNNGWQEYQCQETKDQVILSDNSLFKSVTRSYTHSFDKALQQNMNTFLDCTWEFDEESAKWKASGCTDGRPRPAIEGEQFSGMVHLRNALAEVKVTEGTDTPPPAAEVKEGQALPTFPPHPLLHNFLKDKVIVLHRIVNNGTWSEMNSVGTDMVMYDYFIDFNEKPSWSFLKDESMNYYLSTKLIPSQNTILFFGGHSRSLENYLTIWNIPEEIKYLDPKLFMPKAPSYLGNSFMGLNFQMDRASNQDGDKLYRQITLKPITRDFIKGNIEVTSQVLNRYKQNPTIPAEDNGMSEYNTKANNLGVWKFDDEDKQFVFPELKIVSPTKRDERLMGSFSLSLKDKTTDTFLNGVKVTVKQAKQDIIKKYVAQELARSDAELDRLEQEALDLCSYLEQDEITAIRSELHDKAPTRGTEQAENFYYQGKPFFLVSLVPEFTDKVPTTTYEIPFPNENPACSAIKGQLANEKLPINASLCQVIQPDAKDFDVASVNFRFDHVPEGLYRVMVIFPFTAFIKNRDFTGLDKFKLLNNDVGYGNTGSKSKYGWKLRPVNVGMYKDVLIVGNKHTSIDSGYRYYYVDRTAYGRGFGHSKFILKVLDVGPGYDISHIFKYTIK